MAETDPMIGALLDRRYLVGQPVGEGLLGRVYRAQSVRVLRTCAIKVARAESMLQGRAMQRLLNEAAAGARLDHPNVVAVLDLGEICAGQPYLVMELAEGMTLQKVLKRTARLSVETAIGLGQQLALGLEHVHERGLIHRDLTPANVVIEVSGRARILDFGLALTIDGGTKRLTEPGFAIGTRPFMAPEQVAGEVVDARADLYSLGMLLQHMLGGMPPVDRAFAALIDGLVAHRPDDRTGSATAVVAAFGALAAERAITRSRCAPPPAEPAVERLEVPTARLAPLARLRRPTNAP